MATRISNTTRKASKLKLLFQSRNYSDCCFVINGEKIQAHKLILACSSPVFERMFYGDLSSSDEVEIFDVSASEFKQMLEYLYVEDVTITSVNNAWNLYSLADRYLLKDLAAFCTSYIKKNLTTSTVVVDDITLTSVHNAWKLYSLTDRYVLKDLTAFFTSYIKKNLTMSTLARSFELAHSYGESDLVKCCWTDMIQFTKGVLLCDSDCHMKSTTLSMLLREALFLTGSDKLAAIIIWAINECNENHLSLTSTNIIHVIIDRDLRKHILDKDIKSEILAHSDLLVKDVTKYILKTGDFKKVSKEPDSLVRGCVDSLCHLLSEDIPEDVQYAERIMQDDHILRCGFRQCKKVARPVEFQKGDIFNFDFRCDCKALLFGLVFYTEDVDIIEARPNDTNNQTISIIKNTEGKELLGRTVASLNRTRHEVLFDNPLVLNPNQKYSLQISYSRDDNQPSYVILYYFEPTLSHNNMVFTFFESRGSMIAGLYCYPM